MKKLASALILVCVMMLLVPAGTVVADCWGCHDFHFPDPNGGGFPCSACIGFGDSTGCVQVWECDCWEWFPGSCTIVY
jgi:hypothetical protein